MDEKSLTPIGQGLESSIVSFAGDIKAATMQIAFIRNGLTEGHHITGAMDCLYQVQEKLEYVAEDLAEKIKDIIELDAIAAGEAPFIPQGRHENEAIEALKRARAGDFDLSLSRVMCRAVVMAEKAFTERCKSILVSDDDVAAVVAGLKLEGTTAGDVKA
ncbi:hypothetical protein [Desulfolutivibrio sulfoxidireducens]|uniref:hypothetical protein n=1 Tax=Desulfolutivibrio sulfoxidireducens TaxID=2773299 RepID=UPI00159E2ECF|nr:hypothetical protein [Desulfolutivibrio sulfoxidireducens]QLA16376.1 hypothetical protein GD605_09715 [Desulfolutivibrio sulfoxidireducens]